MNSEAVFGLERAAWPALLIGLGGDVLRANAQAKKTFATDFTGNTARLSAIWSSENGSTAEDSVKGWGQSPPAVLILKLRVNGTVTSFNATVCPLSVNGVSTYLLQLLPEIKAAPSTGEAALKQKLDCVLQLSKTVALDFNNALTGVLAHSSLLLTKVGPENPIHRSLLEIEKSGARAAEIAAELGQFSRQEKETRKVPVGNLNLLVTRCVDSMQHAQGARLRWRQILDPELFAARFDEVKMQQALTKVLENAVQSFGNDANGGQITVQTRNVELTEPTQDRNVRLNAGEYVCVEISDTGAGIPDEVLPKIFEPFFTTKRAPHRGLGLALVYGIISNLAGGVAVSSTPGKGTSARIYLSAEKSFVLQTNTASPSEFKGSGTVLVVDDENLVLTMVDTILTEFGYKVLTASSGAKALTILQQPKTEVDLVITDLVMPGMGGRELTEKIRAAYPDLPVMPTSGYLMADDKAAGKNYLQKPFTSAELLRKVKMAMGAPA